MTRGYDAVTTIVALAAENGDAFSVRIFAPRMTRHCCAGVLHEREQVDAVFFGGRRIHRAHFFRGEDAHVRLFPRRARFELRHTSRLTHHDEEVTGVNALVGSGIEYWRTILALDGQHHDAKVLMDARFTDGYASEPRCLRNAYFFDDHFVVLVARDGDVKEVNDVGT